MFYDDRWLVRHPNSLRTIILLVREGWEETNNVDSLRATIKIEGCYR